MTTTANTATNTYSRYTIEALCTMLGQTMYMAGEARKVGNMEHYNTYNVQAALINNEITARVAVKVGA